MSDRERNKLAAHVAVDLSEGRVDRLWGRVSQQLGGRRRSPRWLWTVPALAALGGVALLIVVGGVGRRGPATTLTGASPWEGAQLETAADALAVTLADGSSLKLEPRSRIEVRDRTPSGVKLVLARGRLACDVTHRPGRSFVVAAAGVEVHVVGTRFSVATFEAAGGTRVEVRVERGAVEVRGPDSSGAAVRVEAGHSWSQVTRTAALGGAAAGESGEASDAGSFLAPLPGAVEGGLAPDAADAHQPEPEGTPPRRATRTQKLSAGRVRQGGDARELFEQARDAWRAGHIDEAARRYQELLVAHPRDPRAGLAAFELGRLRMDHLGDWPGAVKALEQAVALAPGAELREDALARLVTASAAARDPDRCAAARARYLADYPSGVHRRTVAAASCH